MSHPEQASPGGDVWILNHYADAPDRPSGSRHHALARQLQRRGHPVTIFAAGFNHLTQREERLSPWRAARTMRFDGVPFVWLRTFPYSGNGPGRVLNMLSYCVMALLAQVGRPSPRVVVGSTVHPLAALTALLIARARGARFFFEIRDLWPQTLVDLRILDSRSLAARALWALEAHMVRNAEVVISVLPGIRDYLVERGLPTEHVAYLPNGVDLGGVPSPQAEPGHQAVLDVIARRHARGEFVMVYAGAHGLVNRLDVVLDAVRRAVDLGSRPPLGLVLIGDGPEKASLRGTWERHDWVTFADAVPKSSMPAVLAAADAGVVHATATPVYRYGISFNKVFDYFAAELPVLFACATAHDPVTRSGAGIVVGPDDPEALAAAMVDLAGRGPDELAAMGRCGRDLVASEHDLRLLGDRLADLIDGMRPIS